VPLLIRTICAATMLVGSSTVPAEWQTGEGRLLATAGVTSVDGTAGGGIVPMAVLAGYASDGQHGGSVSASRLDTQDFALRGFSAAWSWHNRIELSVARQELNVSTFAALDGEQLRTNSYGAKLRLSGDILYTRMPQISAGILYRDTLNPRLAVLANNTVPDALGAKDRHGVDVYLAATKVFLGGPFGRNWVLNGVLRHSKANQGGLVGFGGDRDNDYSLLGEASVAAFLNRHWLLGAEYRQHPDNLSAFSQDHWADIFLAWFPNKRWSVTAAWVSLGQLSTPVIPYDNDDRNQSGAYFSLTGAF
jgi:hypothetical protein